MTDSQLTAHERLQKIDLDEVESIVVAVLQKFSDFIEQIGFVPASVDLLEFTHWCRCTQADEPADAIFIDPRIYGVFDFIIYACTFDKSLLVGDAVPPIAKVADPPPFAVAAGHNLATIREVLQAEGLKIPLTKGTN